MIQIRKAQIEDSSFILEMIKELAEYEKASDQVLLTLEQLKEDGFGKNSLFESIILELDGKQAGMALFYNRYSTWKGKSLYLEDLYVQPKFRGHGIGLKAMKWLARYAHKTDCHRFEWQVLDWNEPAIKFYEKFNTQLDGEWINCKLEGMQIQNFAQELI
jgi:GNAT superfamily N-acetyltransferase